MNEIQRNPVIESTVGLDMSLTHTGICIKQGVRVRLETVKTTPKTKPNDIERMSYIVGEVMARIPKDVSMIAIEDFFTPHNPLQIRAAIGLVGLSTLMRNQLYYAGYPFYIVVGTQLKKYATGKGTGDKSIVVREVYKKWGVEAKDDHQADATTLAYLAEAIYQSRNGEDMSGLPKYQMEVLQKVIKERPSYNIK